MLKLKLVNSKIPTENREFELSPESLLDGEYFIGRSQKCGIVLSSPEVSRVHGSISYKEGQYYFTDLASLSGSRINDQIALVNQKYPLKQNDIIRIGEFILAIAEASTNGTQSTNGTAAHAEQVQRETPTQPQPAAYTLSIPQVSQYPTEPSRPPSEYMPVAVVPPEQMTRWTQGKLTVRCVAVIDETQDAKTFRFAADPPVLFTYKPGQFVTLDLEINGKPVKRSYSISSTPSRPHTLEITVKRVPAPPDLPTAPAGLVSNWLHDTIKVGSEIKLSGPSGKFTCFENPCQKLLFISAGSGITPMMSMSRWMLDTAADCDIVFFHNARSPRDIIYRQELEWMSSRHPKFRLAIALTRLEPGQAWSGLVGRLNEYMMYASVPDFWQRTVYVCGPDGFMRSVKTLLEGMGFPMQNYYEESFGGAKKAKPPKSLSAPSPTIVTTPPPAASVAKVTPAVPEPVVSTPTPAPSTLAAPVATSACVVFAKSGKEVTCDGETPILELAEQEGIELDSSCRSGVCGTCKGRKLQGEVKYQADPDALDDSEQEEGYILTCIACPVGRVVVEA